MRAYEVYVIHTFVSRYAYAEYTGVTVKLSWSYVKYTDYTFSYVGMEGVRTLSVLLALEWNNCKMEAAMDTDEAREVSLEPEGTAVDTQ